MNIFEIIYLVTERFAFTLTKSNNFGTNMEERLSERRSGGKIENYNFGENNKVTGKCEYLWNIV